MEKKEQHIIPNCYLKAWCDPNTPSGQEPYIWIHPKERGKPKRKAPHNCFTELDRYTIFSEGGERGLKIEDTLGSIEGRFAAIRDRLTAAAQITREEHFHLCAFVAAMKSRVKPMAEHWKTLWIDVKKKGEAMAKAHGAEPKWPEMEELVLNANPNLVEATLQTLTPLLMAMKAGIYIARSKTFITSDDPCVWFNPEWYKLPPAYRSPALANPKIEISLPMSAKALLLFTHRPEFAGFFKADDRFVDEMNRRTRFHAYETFVTHNGASSSYWFDRGEIPEDTWENSEEGKAVIARRDAILKNMPQPDQKDGGWPT